MRDIAATIDQLKRAESVARLDRLVIAYAVDHTGAELRAWLRRFVQRVEADLAVERAEDERRDRHVSVKHGPDSMGTLFAYLPAHELAAIEADQLVAWCTGTEAAESVISANIAVTIPADVLAGAVAGFADSTDGRWAVPAAWITAVVGAGSTFWSRIVTDPVTNDILSHEYLGRRRNRGPSVARQAPGRSPAATKSLGRRAQRAVRPLCRRHHQMKGHGILRWSTRPPKPLIVEIYRDPVDIEYAA